MIKVCIIGANGYTGFELMKLLANHPKATLVSAVSRSNVGTKISDIYPPLERFYGGKVFDELNIDALAKSCDVAFTALPHASSAEIGGKLFNKGLKVIDLSADFRYNNIDVYQSTYKVTHPCPELNAKAVYGLTEINRQLIKKCGIVGNPGCYTTTSILPLYPLLKQKLVSENGIIIDAKSGVTGAGRKADVDYNICETQSNFKAYSVTTHRHTSEIEEKLSFGNKTIAVQFTPHLLPVKRGILATVYATLNDGVTGADIAKAFKDIYANERFVKVNAEGVLPELKWVVGSNVCQIGYKLDERTNRIILVSVLDNLLKGASGAAIQNMNVMMGFDEGMGLPIVANYL